jgi:hypothetical protein
MKSYQKKILFAFFVIVFVGLACAFYLPTNNISAAGLEVSYPKLPTNSAPPTTSDTPLEKYLKYVFDLGIQIGFWCVFLTLVVSGILYFVSPAAPGALAIARDRISGAISGLLILSLLYLIITTLNPYLAIFKLNKLDEIPAVTPTTKEAGVNFYNSSDCSGIADTNILSIPNLGSLKNKINSVSIVPNEQEDLFYISVLYDVTNYWGKCQYINPNEECVKVSPFAASASIYPFDFKPDGDGVYFYRKSFFNEEGGWLKITNSEIENKGSDSLYGADLNELKFTGSASSDYDNLKNCTVPEDEQDCINYDKKGNCIQKKCPTLAGENISSIKISGDYLVLLIYENPSDDRNPWWTSCQAFPTNDDVNKEGPQQIKWEGIRNNGQTPNFIVIIPVAQK